MVSTILTRFYKLLTTLNYRHYTSYSNSITYLFFKIRSRKKLATRPQTTVPFYLRVRWHESECPFYFFVVWTSASVIKFYSYVEEMIVIWLS